MPTTDPPRVTAIHLAATRGGPMSAVDRVVAEAGRGLVGDRHHGSRHRHLTVVSATQLAQAQERLGEPIAPGATRRNVTISHGHVPAEPGTRLRLGDVEAEVVRVAAPCHVMDEVIAPGAMRALSGLAGSVCRVVSSGTIEVGDEVDLDAGPATAAMRVLVRGHVQGVFFRASTRDEALRRRVDGWVRNLPDGRVEAHLEGRPDDVDDVLAWIRAGGPPRAHVADVEVEPVAPERPDGFRVRR